MKLYYFPVAPNPTRVLIYLAEKGIDNIDLVPVDLRKGEQRQEAHLARNPDGNLPVLELDDGDCLTESLAIMEYLEELHPEPPMIGSDPLARARIRSLERKVETQLLNPIGRLVHATRSPIGLPPNPAVADAERALLPASFERLDGLVGSRPFAAGDAPTIVDCTLFATLQFGQFFGVDIPAGCDNLQRWYAAFQQRPSTSFEFPE